MKNILLAVMFVAALLSACCAPPPVPIPPKPFTVTPGEDPVACYMHWADDNGKLDNPQIAPDPCSFDSLQSCSTNR